MSSFNFNKVILGGRLCAKPELKTTPSGVMVTQFTVAVTRKYGGASRTSPPTAENGTASVGEERQSDFIRVVAWRSLAEFVCKYFGKGSSICVVGAIQTRTWTDKNGKKQYSTEVIADEVSFVDSKGESSAAVPPPSDADAPPPAYYTPGGGNAPKFEEIADDDELPF